MSSSKCKPAEFLKNILTGPGRGNDQRPFMWYNLAMQRNAGNFSLDPNSDAVRWSAFVSTLLTKDSYSTGSKQIKINNPKLSGINSGRYHPSLINFIEDVAKFHAALDPKSEASEFIDSIRSGAEFNNFVSSAGFNKWVEGIKQSRSDEEKIRDISGDYYQLVVEENDVAFSKIVAESGGPTNMSRISKLIKNNLEAIPKNVHSILSDGTKKIRVHDALIRAIMEAIQEIYKSAVGKAHSTLKDNPLQQKLYENISSMWNDTPNDLKSLLLSMMSVFYVKDGKWVVMPEPFETHLGNTSEARINLKTQYYAPTGKSVGTQVPQFILSIPPVNTGKNSNVLKDIYFAAYVEAMEKYKKGSDLSLSDELLFPLKTDNMYFKSVIEMTKKLCSSMSEGEKDESDILDKRRFYKPVGGQYVLKSLSESDLAEDDNCHHLGIGIKSPFCNKILACLTSSASSEDFSSCEEIINNSEVFKDVIVRVGFIHPEIISRVIARFGFKYKNKFNPLTGETVSIYESVDDLLTRFSNSDSNSLFGGHNLKLSEIATKIKNNPNLKKYLEQIIELSRGQSNIGMQNRDFSKITSTDAISSYVKKYNIPAYHRMANPSGKNLMLMTRVPAIQPTPLHAYNQVKALPFLFGSSGISNLGYMGGFGNPKLLIRQGGGGGYGKWPNCTDSMKKLIQSQIINMRSHGKKLDKALYAKIKDILTRLEEDSKQLHTLERELFYFYAVARNFQDRTDQTVSEEYIKKILDKHGEYMKDYLQNSQRIGRAAAKVEVFIDKLEADDKGKIPEDPKKSSAIQKYQLQFS